MKRLLLVLVGILVLSGYAAAAEPNWQYLFDDEELSASFYVDINSVTKHGFWEKRVPKKSGLLKTVCNNRCTYMIVYHQINCSTKETGVKNYYLYDKNNKVVGNGEVPFSPEVFPPGSYGDLVIDSICAGNPFPSK